AVGPLAARSRAAVASALGRAVSAAVAALRAGAAVLPRSTSEHDLAGEDLGAVALLALLVLIAGGAEGALHEDAAALVEVPRQGLAALPPHDDGVPLGPLLADLVDVEIALRRREPEL